MVVSRIITLLILLLNTIPSLEQQPTDVSETGRITSGLAIKIIGCFRDKKVPICQNKPETIDVTECANSSILGGMRISENDLNQFFEKLYETKNTPRAFQENLFSEMKTRITRKGAFYDNVILQMVDIVKKIINDNTLTDNDYIEVYCHLHVATYIVENMLKAAQSCYNDLKLLTDKLPETDREVGRTKTKVSLTKNHLFESIKNQYEPATILVKPEFSQLVGLVLKHDMGESGHIHDIVQRYVIATLEAMQAYKRSHDIHELGIFHTIPRCNMEY